MNLLSGTVLGSAAVVASPALWQALVTGTVPVDVALQRYLVAAGACWAALSMVAAMIGAVPGSPAQQGEPVRATTDETATTESPGAAPPGSD